MYNSAEIKTVGPHSQIVQLDTAAKCVHVNRKDKKKQKNNNNPFPECSDASMLCALCKEVGRTFISPLRRLRLQHLFWRGACAVLMYEFPRGRWSCELSKREKKKHSLSRVCVWVAWLRFRSLPSSPLTSITQQQQQTNTLQQRRVLHTLTCSCSLNQEM